MLGELGEQIGVQAVSRSGHKLAFSRGVFDTNIWRFDLNGSNKMVERNRSWIASSRFDQQPAISPDGSKIAFETTRTGFSEIWIASRDGSNAIPLTRFEAFVSIPLM
jgi:Tol biopolymer transport system component